MKTISITVQIAALAICFAAQFHPAGVTGMPGTRKAMQTLEVFAGPALDTPAQIAMHAFTEDAYGPSPSP